MPKTLRAESVKAVAVKAVAPVAPIAQPEIALYDAQGNVIGKMTLAAKTFATGSRGFFTQAKMAIGDKRYQCQFQLVEIGSKPGAIAK